MQALEPTARLRLEMDTFCDFSLKYSGFFKGGGDDRMIYSRIYGIFRSKKVLI